MQKQQALFYTAKKEASGLFDEFSLDDQQNHLEPQQNYEHTQHQNHSTKPPHINTHFDSHDLAAAAVLAAAHSPQDFTNSKLELSLSASSSSLSSSEFSLYSSSSSFASSLAASNNDESNDCQQLDSVNTAKTAANSKSKRRKTLDDDLADKQANPMTTLPNKELDTQMISMNSMSLNSDLEIEVASTLVGMKWARK